MRLSLAIAARLIGVLAVIIAAGGSANGASITVMVTASPVKPLLLTKVQDLDLGSITLGPGSWSNATIAISQAGTFTCANSNVTCTGMTQPAQYNVQGSNQQTVYVSSPSVTLTNQSDPSKTLTLVTDAPASIALKNSGSPGTNFSIGGSVSINSTTSPGIYVGSFNVTVDY